MLIINEDNWKDHAIDHRTMGRGLVPRDWTKRPYGDAALAGTFEVSKIPSVPRGNWSARIRHLTDTGRRLSDLMKAAEVPVLNQSYLGYCHGFAPAGAAMALTAWMGAPTVKLSGSSIAAPVVGFQNRGAWIMDDLRQFAAHGVNTVEEYPELSTDPRDYNETSKRQAGTRRLARWYEGNRRSFDQTISCLLNHVPVVVGLNWWGHAIYYVDAVEIRPGVFGVFARNSWGPEYGDDGWFVLEEGRATPDEQYMPLAMMAA